MQLSKEHDKLYIPYSGGHDSSFICLCYKECLKENLLHKDIYSIFHYNFHADGVRLQLDWDRAEYWFNKYVNLPIEWKDLNVLDKVHAENILNLVIKHKYPYGICAQFYMCSLQDAPCVEKYMHLFRHNNPGHATRLERPNSIEISFFEEVAYSMMTPYTHRHRIRDGERFINDEFYGKAYMYNVGHSITYWMCYPELFNLYPKMPTMPTKHSSPLFKSKKGQSLLRYYKSIDLKQGPYEIPILLPNGELVMFVEQTQEFFNRQT